MKNIKFIFTVLDLQVEATRKNIKYLHISVHPPTGNIIVSAPLEFRDDEIKNAVIKRVPWIRKHRRTLLEAKRESSREMVSNESHYLWGQRYLLEVKSASSNEVTTNGKKIILRTTNFNNHEKKYRQLYNFYRLELKKKSVPILKNHEAQLQIYGVKLKYTKMKTRWGSFSEKTNTITLNVDLAKYPLKYTNYIIAHELSHLTSSRHDKDFQQHLAKLIPNWDVINENLRLLLISS